MAPGLESYGAPPAGARPQSLLELRREQPDEDTEQDGSPVGRAVCPLKRRHAVGDHAPFVLGDARGFLKQRDAVRGELRPLDLKEVIEPVKRGSRDCRRARPRSRVRAIVPDGSLIVARIGMSIGRGPVR